MGGDGRPAAEDVEDGGVFDLPVIVEFVAGGGFEDGFCVEEFLVEGGGEGGICGERCGDGDGC